MTCDGLELSATTPVLELVSNEPTLGLSASVPTLTLESGDCELILSVDSTLEFVVTTQSLSLASNTIDLCLTTPIPVGVGESNTASNCGNSGVGLFHQKTGVDLEFRNLRSLTSSITIDVDATDCTVDFDFDETALNRYNIEPSGDKDGVNLSYLLPESTIPTLFRLYRNGVRQRRDDSGTCDFALSESGGVGSGYDTIEITTDALLNWETLTADYTVAA